VSWTDKRGPGRRNGQLIDPAERDGNLGILAVGLSEPQNLDAAFLRPSPALYNNYDDIDALLAAPRRLKRVGA
jgi:selenocysteine lyase/cysteine desulfurase